MEACVSFYRQEKKTGNRSVIIFKHPVKYCIIANDETFNLFEEEKEHPAVKERNLGSNVSTYRQ